MISTWVALIGCMMFLWGALTILLTGFQTGWFTTIVGVIILWFANIVQDIER